MIRPGRSSLALIALVAVSAVTVAQGPPMAPGPPAPGMPEVNPMVSFYVSGSYGGGSTASMVLGSADWYETLMFVGDTRDRNICMGGTTGSRVGTAILPDGQHPVLTWRIAVKREAFDGSAATIKIRWRRDVDGDDIQPVTDVEDEFTWQASEGATRTLDFVRQAPPAVPNCETQGIEMRYAVEGAPELRQSLIGYDVWLLQRLPSGERRTQRFQTSGQQGASVSFAFPTVNLEMPGKAGAPPSTIDLRVTGRVTGRLRRDGRIDLAVGAGRFVGPAGGRGIHQGNGGRTRLTVAQNETVELTPPPLFGDDGDGPYTEVLRDARTAIRVRARRLW